MKVRSFFSRSYFIGNSFAVSHRITARVTGGHFEYRIVRTEDEQLSVQFVAVLYRAVYECESMLDLYIWAWHLLMDTIGCWGVMYYELYYLMKII